MVDIFLLFLGFFQVWCLAQFLDHPFVVFSHRDETKVVCAGERCPVRLLWLPRTVEQAGTGLERLSRLVPVCDTGMSPSRSGNCGAEDLGLCQFTKVSTDFVHTIWQRKING